MACFPMSSALAHERPRRRRWARKRRPASYRSQLSVDQSVRIAEGVRVELWPDEAEPQHVMRGHAYMGKDGSPIDLYFRRGACLRARAATSAAHLDSQMERSPR